MNAYTAENAGEDVVERHSEESLRHEEVYVVLSGRANFELDGQALDAPAGTIVFLRDPTVRRYATAAEPHTTVLAVGGRPGEAYTPSAWEWYFEAERFRDPFDPEAAMRLMDEANERFPENAGASTRPPLGGARRSAGRRLGVAATCDRARPAVARVGAPRRGPRLDSRPPRLIRASTRPRGPEAGANRRRSGVGQSKAGIRATGIRSADSCSERTQPPGRRCGRHRRPPRGSAAPSAASGAPSRHRARPCTSCAPCRPRRCRRRRRCSRRARRTSARRPRATGRGPTRRPRSGRGSSTTSFLPPIPPG